QGAEDFVTEISVIVQQCAPFNVQKWKCVLDVVKERIVTKVQDSFDIDDTSTEHTKKVILDTAKRLYRTHKCKLHRHFQKHEIPEEALENKLRTQEISIRNKLNKSKQVNNHTCGWKSCQAISCEKRDHETQKEPNFQDLVEEAALQKLQGTNEDTNKDQIVNAFFQTIVGEQSGYCRGLGAGIQLTLLTNERQMHQSIEMKLKEVENELQRERNMREEMAAHFEESQRQILESQRTIKERNDKQIEERMASVLFRMKTFS
ncbi:hypothetical protein glysoja_043368, partial [Glycine soja]